MTLGDRRRFALRTRLVAAALFVGLVSVGLRAANLQTVRHGELSRLSREEYLSDLRVPARRGHIYDRNGKPLAISVDVPSVYANPSVIQDPRQAARQLAASLDAELDPIYQRLASDRLFVWLARQVSPEVAQKVEALGVEGVAITKESRRFYPNRELGAHIIGFTGVDAAGLEGIERELDRTLAGEPQVVAALRDARGRAVLAADVDPELHSAGADVELSVDLRLQHAAQVALRRVVSDSDAAAAVAVVLDVPTAEVLSVAVEPTFNPNQPSRAPVATRRNRAITDMFEPGSAMKPLVVAGALEAGTVEARQRVFCEEGAYLIGNHTIRDSKPAGWLSLTEIIAKSSNIGVAKIGQSLGPVRLADHLRQLGFASKTGVEFPGETAGSLRDASSWSRVGNATISFGHGVAVSALQLAAAYRVLASGGIYRAPRLVRSVTTPDGRPVSQRGPVERRVVGTVTAKQVTQMMEAAVSPDGTAWRAAVAGYRVAGKTGTAQKVDPVAGGYSSDRFVAVFAGFMPADAPRVVIVVVVDEPKRAHSGGRVAAPVFAEIGEAAMRYLGVVPTERVLPSGPVTSGVARATVANPRQPVVTPTAAVARQGDAGVLAGTVPSFIGLTARQALMRLVETGEGLDLELEGSGRVVRQTPPPGSAGGRGSRVTLVLAPER